MALQSGSVSQLASVLRDSSIRRTAIVGAAASALAPSCLPDAPSWVAHVTEQLWSAAGFSSAADLRSVTRIDTGTNRQAVPLEGLLAALDGVRLDLGGRIASATAAADIPPNILHGLLADVLRSGCLTIITTNFDVLIERAYATKTGHAPGVWVDGTPFDPAAQLFKLHGSGDRLQSLRHTFRQVNRPYAAEVRAGVRAATSQSLILLGYAGADFDVMQMIDDTVSALPVLWLVTPDRVPVEAARRLARKRDVYLCEGTFDDLLKSFGMPAAQYRPTGEHMWSQTDPQIASLTPMEACTALLPVLYQARVAQEESVTLYREFRSMLVARREMRRVSHLAEAAEAQFETRAFGGLARASWHYIMSASRRTWQQSFSDAADSLERILYGLLVPLLRPFTLAVHAYAVRSATGPSRLWMRFRVARSSAALVGPGRTVGVLEELLRDADHDMYLTGAIHLRLALARAQLLDNHWRDDVAEAERCFSFEGRTDELGDTYRVAGLCALAEGDLPLARSLEERSRQYHIDHGQTVGARQSGLLRAAIVRTPRFARAMVRWA